MTSSNTEHEIGPKMAAEVINGACSISRLLCMRAQGRGEEHSFLCKVTAENEKSTICGGQAKKACKCLASQPEVG